MSPSLEAATDDPAAEAERERAARTQHGDALIDRLERQSSLADPAADALVEACAALPGGMGWAMFEAALGDGLGAVGDAPPELATVLADALVPPSWIDHDLVEAGQVAWWRVGGLAQLLTLTSASLAYGYGSANLARPLAATGRLTQMAPRRLAETGRWVATATRPGSLRPGGDAIAATVRLRLVHALVRRHLLSASWREQWGTPISVADTLATGMSGFFVVPLRAMEDLGIRHTPAEREAMTHLWGWISVLMGVPEEHVPRTFAETEQWSDAAKAVAPGPIGASPDLLEALLFSGQRYDGLPGPASFLARQLSGHVFGALARRWMGDERADALGAPNTPLKHLPLALRPLFVGRDVIRATGLLGSDEQIARFEHALQLRIMDSSGLADRAVSPEEIEAEPVLADVA